MDIRQALAVADLGTAPMPANNFTSDKLRKAEQIAERVFAQAEEHGARIAGTPDEWRKSWLRSERFMLLDVPVHFIARPMKATDRNKVLGCLQASAESVEPIVVDMNKNKIGIGHSGYFPPVIVVDGKHRHAAAQMQGRETMRAWVGELAAQALGMMIRKGARLVVQKQEPVDIEVATADTVQKFKQYQVTSLEATIQIFGAGMGGPGASLGQGSGPVMPGPSMVMKPTATPGKVGMQSKGMRKRKLRTSGYMGYKNATDTQRAKTKGGSKSEMADQLKGSGYYGYKDATDTQRQKTKGATESEMADPKLRHANYSSEPDIEELKGSGAKVAKIVTHYKSALKAGYKPELQAVAPPGMESTVRSLKRHFGEKSSSPFAISWWLHNKRKKSKSTVHADFVPSHEDVDLHERPPKVKPPKV
jgi:hypothetical protein